MDWGFLTKSLAKPRQEKSFLLFFLIWNKKAAVYTSLKTFNRMKFSFYCFIAMLLMGCQAPAQIKWPAFSGGKVSLITGVEAEQRFKISERLGTMELHGKPGKVKVAVIEGENIVMANLLDEEWEKLVHIIVIKGNLKVDSAITLTKSQPDLLVLGSLETKIFMVGNAHQRITGDALIQYALLGGGNDGSIKIDGKTAVPYVISMDHDIGLNAPYAQWFDWNEGTMNLLLREIYNPVQEQWNFDYLVQRIREGKPIRRKASQDTTFQGIWTEWLDLWGRDSTVLNFESFKDFLETENILLSFNYMDGYDLPAEIFELKKLEALNCMHVELNALPAEIQKCTRLKVLNLTFCQLESIPEEIGQLANLEELWLSGNPLKALPSSIFKLSQLKTLVLDKDSFSPEEQKKIKKGLPKTAVLFY